MLLKDAYSYDANGDNTLIESFSVFGGLDFPGGSQQLEYDNHLLTSIIELVPDDNGELQPVNKTTYSYTGFGKRETENAFTWDIEKEDWRPIEELVYGFDNEQRLIAAETHRFNQDTPEERERLTYEYVADENLALESYFTWNGSNFLLTERQHYYYSDGMTASPEPLADTLPLIASPNPSTGLISLNLSAPASLRIYNAQGALLRNAVYQPEDLIELGDLPGGLYFISAVSAQKQYSGRLIKE